MELSANLTPEDFDDNPILQHYASKYYDPVKAREYYLRTRELKGRPEGEKLTKENRENQRAASSYVRNQISTERKAESEKARSDNASSMDGLRTTARATVDGIKVKLQARVEQLKVDAFNAVPKPKLNKISPSATDQQKAFLTRENQKMMNAYNQKVAAGQKTASEQGRKEQEASRAEIRKVGEELKSKVAAVRQSYLAARQASAEKYRTTMQTEMANIRDQVR